jgi:hypothetical protein
MAQGYHRPNLPAIVGTSLRNQQLQEPTPVHSPTRPRDAAQGARSRRRWAGTTLLVRPDRQAQRAHGRAIAIRGFASWRSRWIAMQRRRGSPSGVCDWIGLKFRAVGAAPESLVTGLPSGSALKRAAGESSVNYGRLGALDRSRGSAQSGDCRAGMRSRLPRTQTSTMGVRPSEALPQRSARRGDDVASAALGAAGATGPRTSISALVEGGVPSRARPVADQRRAISKRSRLAGMRASSLVSVWKASQIESGSLVRW